MADPKPYKTGREQAISSQNAIGESLPFDAGDIFLYFKIYHSVTLKVRHVLCCLKRKFLRSLNSLWPDV